MPVPSIRKIDKMPFQSTSWTIECQSYLGKEIQKGVGGSMWFFAKGNLDIRQKRLGFFRRICWKVKQISF